MRVESNEEPAGGRWPVRHCGGGAAARHTRRPPMAWYSYHGGQPHRALVATRRYRRLSGSYGEIALHPTEPRVETQMTEVGEVPRRRCSFRRGAEGHGGGLATAERLRSARGPRRPVERLRTAEAVRAVQLLPQPARPPRLHTASACLHPLLRSFAVPHQPAIRD